MEIQLEAFRINESRRNLNYPHSAYLKVYCFVYLIYCLLFEVRLTYISFQFYYSCRNSHLKLMKICCFFK